MSARYALHYVSADSPGRDATWSVYREEYTTIESDEPIESATVRVSTHATEAEADAEATRLQGGAA